MVKNEYLVIQLNECNSGYYFHLYSFAITYLDCTNDTVKVEHNLYFFNLWIWKPFNSSSAVNIAQFLLE